MNTKVLESTQQNIELVASQIAKGSVVAFATETVFGLGASIYNVDAIDKIYEIKGRPKDNPLIVHIDSIDSLQTVGKNIKSSAKTLLKVFAPGPITVVVERADTVPSQVSAGLDTVAVRIPKLATARELIALSGPICAPSANISTRVSPTTANHVLEDLDGKIEYILDSNNSGSVGIESTIVDCTKNIPIILREGFVTKEEIEKALNQKVRVIRSADTAVAPGVKYKHYAPSVPLIYVPHCNTVVSKVLKVYDQYKDSTAVILCTDENRERYGDCNIYSLGSDPNTCARTLYSALRHLEKSYSVIIAEGFEKVGVLRVLDNKLTKAASTVIDGDKKYSKQRWAESNKRAIEKSKPLTKSTDQNLDTVKENNLQKTNTVDKDIFQVVKLDNSQRQFVKINSVPKTIFAIMFVCSGNTCRSKMMEWIFKSFVSDSPYKFIINSSGLFASDNEPMSCNSQLALQDLGIDFEPSFAKRFDINDCNKYDLIVTMTKSHKQSLCNLPNVVSMSELCGKDIEDPYGCDLDQYKNVATQLKTACKNILDRLLAID